MWGADGGRRFPADQDGRFPGPGDNTGVPGRVTDSGGWRHRYSCQLIFTTEPVMTAGPEALNSAVASAATATFVPLIETRCAEGISISRPLSSSFVMTAS